MLRVLIVDDEPLARQRARELVEETRGFSVAGECGNGLEAVAALREGGSDLVLLDVRMPGLGGFEVIERVGPGRMPPVVFLTAFAEHAVHAFDVRAVDYVEKPWTRERLARALRRASVEMDRRRSSFGPGSQATSLVLRAGGRRVLVPIETIERIESAANYARVHAEGREYLTRETMTVLAQRLPVQRFVRIHRSTIVAIAAVRELVHDGSGELELVLRGGARLRCGRTYRAAVRGVFEGARRDGKHR